MPGPGQDAHQGPFGYPVPQPQSQSLRGRGGRRRPVLLERRASGVVDREVGQVRVRRIGRLALRAEPGLQVGPELGGGARYPDLGAERWQSLGYFGRGEELVGPVRLGRGPGHRDVTGAQLVGEVGQHARLQVPLRAVPFIWLRIDDQRQRSFVTAY